VRWMDNRLDRTARPVANYSLLFDPVVANMAAVATVKFGETGSQLVSNAGEYGCLRCSPRHLFSLLPLCLALQHLRDLDHDGDLDVVLGVRNGDSLVTEVGIEHGGLFSWSQHNRMAWLSHPHPCVYLDHRSWHGLKIVELGPSVVGLWTCGELRRLHSLCIRGCAEPAHNSPRLTCNS
jgi:hypothetical protein